MTHGKRLISGRVRIFCAGLSMLAAGCGQPGMKGPGKSIEDRALQQQRDRIAADPIGFLRMSLASAKRLDAFTMIFERQERLGLFKELHPIEIIFTEYRDEPFSIRFTWTDDDSEYLQCVFVAGANEGKVLLLPRHGLLGLPPSVAAYDPMMAVTFGKARNPITDFGPRRMLERTLDRIEKAKPFGEVKIRLLDEKAIGADEEPCFHLEIRYPEGDEFPCKLHDLYISTRTMLPVGSYLWLPGKEERSPQTLDAMYVYGRLNPNVELSDANFSIDESLAKKSPSKATSQPAPETTP